MSITRRLPNTNETIKIAINAAVLQLSRVAPEDVAITPDTQAKLGPANTAWNAVVAGSASALATQTNATADSDKKQALAKKYIRGFFKVFNVGISIENYTKEQRPNFKIAVTDNKIPTINSEADIILWGDRIVTGDAARVAAGGNAMSNPSAAQVATAVGNFVTSNNNKVLMIDAYKKSLEAVDALVAATLAIILKVWDETETFFNQYDAPTKRAKCRPWGIRYVSDVIITINVAVKNAKDDSAITTSSTYFEEGDTTHVPDEAGNIVIETTVSDEATLITTAPYFTADTTVIPFVTGVTVYTVVIKLVPSITDETEEQDEEEEEEEGK